MHATYKVEFEKDTPPQELFLERLSSVAGFGVVPSIRKIQSLKIDDVNGASFHISNENNSVMVSIIGHDKIGYLMEAAIGPSFYTILSNKLIMIYTGLEGQLSIGSDSFKMIDKDCKKCFAEGPIIVEPSFWHVTFTAQSPKKEVIEKLPY